MLLTIFFCNPVTDISSTTDLDTIILSIESINDAMFVSQPSTQIINRDFHWEQRKDPKLKQLIDYLEREILPNNDMMLERLLHKLPVSFLRTRYFIY